MNNDKTVELHFTSQEVVEIKHALQLHFDVLNDMCLEPFFNPLTSDRDGMNSEQLAVARKESGETIDRLIRVATVLERIEHHV